MATTHHQHYVPRSYLKAWESSVRNTREPNKRFSGVYIFEDDDSKGEGRNIKSVLWSQSVYTVKYDDYQYLCGKYKKLDDDFLFQIRDILDNRYKQKINAIYDGNVLASDQDIINNFAKLDRWEFIYSDGNAAPKERIQNGIKSLTSQCLENGLSDIFEKDWSTTRDRFISEVEKAVLTGGRPYRIPIEIAEQVVRFLYSMICRNPEFDAFGAYNKTRELILQPIAEVYGFNEELADDIMHSFWIGELYRMLFDNKSGFFSLNVSNTFSNHQIALFKRSGSSSFITSDNPAFRHLSLVESQNMNGFLFPLSPDFLLMIANGNEGIDAVECIIANDDMVRKINRIVANHKTDYLISKQRYLPV